MRADRHAFTRALPSVRPTRPPNQASPPPAGPPLAFRPGRDGTAGNRTVTTREARESHRRAMSLGARVTNLRPSRSQRENRAALCAIPRTGRGRTLVNHSACGQRNHSGGGLSGLGMVCALGNLQLMMTRAVRPAPARVTRARGSKSGRRAISSDTIHYKRARRDVRDETFAARPRPVRASPRVTIGAPEPPANVC